MVKKSGFLTIDSAEDLGPVRGTIWEAIAVGFWTVNFLDRIKICLVGWRTIPVASVPDVVRCGLVAYDK
jgi:hypothetical protein